MPIFALSCIDKPDSLALRMATREAHLQYIREQGEAVRLAGPYLDDKGDLCGSLIFLEAETVDAAKALNAADPYTLAGLFERVDIRPFRPLIGKL